MLLKTLVVMLFIANLVALGSAFFSLVKGQGQRGHSTARRLLLRVSLAALLLLVVAYGFYTGELGISAPWLGRG